MLSEDARHGALKVRVTIGNPEIDPNKIHKRDVTPILMAVAIST